MTDTEIIGAAATAEMYGVSADTVARWADEGVIPSFRTPGGHRRFRRSDIEADIESRRIVPEQATATTPDDEAAA